MGSSGMGSTSTANGLGQGGGGGGMGGFTQVIQELVKPGSLVKKGDVVAEFDRQYMLQRLDDYRAAVAQSDLNLKSLKANLEVTLKAHDQTIETARAAMEKARIDLKTIPVLSQMDTEKLRLAFDAAEAKYKQLLNEVKMYETSQRADIRNAELDAEQARIELKRNEANAERMVVRAPLDGLTVMQQTFRGSDFSPIQAGDQLMPGQFFMQIVDPSSMVVNATVNQVDVERLRIGHRARVRFDAYPDLELPARIESVGGLAKAGGSRDSFMKELPIRLKIEQMDKRVIPDLSVSVDVILDQADGVVAPAGAIFRDATNNHPFVYVQSAEGWTRRDVTLAGASFLNVAIREGLKPGEVIALDRPPAPQRDN
jgi:multidrug resistance efflux pump